MKRLLSILGAIGLTATASSAVVSCGTAQITNKVENGNQITFDIHLKAESSADAQRKYDVFDDDGSHLRQNATFKLINKDNFTYEVTFTAQKGKTYAVYSTHNGFAGSKISNDFSL